MSSPGCPLEKAGGPQMVQRRRFDEQAFYSAALCGPAALLAVCPGTSCKGERDYRVLWEGVPPELLPPGTARLYCSRAGLRLFLLDRASAGWDEARSRLPEAVGRLCPADSFDLLKLYHEALGGFTAYWAAAGPGGGTDALPLEGGLLAAPGGTLSWLYYMFHAVRAAGYRGLPGLQALLDAEARGPAPWVEAPPPPEPPECPGCLGPIEECFTPGCRNNDRERMRPDPWCFTHGGLCDCLSPPGDLELLGLPRRDDLTDFYGRAAAGGLAASGRRAERLGRLQPVFETARLLLAKNRPLRWAWIGAVHGAGRARVPPAEELPHRREASPGPR